MNEKVENDKLNTFYKLEGDKIIEVNKDLYDVVYSSLEELVLLLNAKEFAIQKGNEELNKFQELAAKLAATLIMEGYEVEFDGLDIGSMI